MDVLKTTPAQPNVLPNIRRAPGLTLTPEGYPGYSTELGGSSWRSRMVIMRIGQDIIC